MAYERELAAAKKAAFVAARLCQTVQKSLLLSDVQSKSDKTPVTVADYGSQALVSFVLKRELPSESFSLVAEEDSVDLRKDESQEMLKRITKLVNDTLSSDGTYDFSPLSEDDVLAAIDSGKSEGGSHGQHWVLDPIDGTKGFVRGDQYAIALALLDEGNVMLGVLACPNLPLPSTGLSHQHSLQSQVGCLFSARVGAGTYMEFLDGSPPPTKVNVSTIENPAEALFFEPFEAAHSMRDLSGSIAKHHPFEWIARQNMVPWLEVIEPYIYVFIIKVTVRRYGTMQLVALWSQVENTEFDCAFGASECPSCNGVSGLTELVALPFQKSKAGGVVTDAAGNPLDFSIGKHLDLEKGIIVTSRKLMPSLLNAVQEVLKEQS